LSIRPWTSKVGGFARSIDRPLVYTSLSRTTSSKFSMPCSGESQGNASGKEATETRSFATFLSVPRVAAFSFYSVTSGSSDVNLTKDTSVKPEEKAGLKQIGRGNRRQSSVTKHSLNDDATPWTVSSCRKGTSSTTAHSGEELSRHWDQGRPKRARAFYVQWFSKCCEVPIAFTPAVATGHARC
jgi:hypothetical protein